MQDEKAINQMTDNKNGWWDTEEKLQSLEAEQNSTEMPSLYCDNCNWLSPTEAGQGQVSRLLQHLCMRNARRVYHGNSHPNIERPEWCGGKITV